MHSLVLELTYRATKNVSIATVRKTTIRANFRPPISSHCWTNSKPWCGLQLQLTGGELFIRKETRDLLRHLQQRELGRQFDQQPDSPG